MRVNRMVGLFSVAALVLAASTESQASVSSWTGTFNVGHNYGTGTMVLREGKLPSGAADNLDGLIGTLVLNQTNGQQVTCTLEGPRSASVRSDRVLVRGDCRKAGTRFWYAFYLAKAPNAFHGYYTASTSPPTASNGLIGVPEEVFSKLGFVAAIWGQK